MVIPTDSSSWFQVLFPMSGQDYVVLFPLPAATWSEEECVALAHDAFDRIVREAKRSATFEVVDRPDGTEAAQR